MSITKTESSTQVQSVMQRHPVKVLESDAITDAVDRMRENHVSALPVVDEGGYLKGILTLNDFLRLIQDTATTLKDSFPRYEDAYWVTQLVRESFGSDDVSSAMTTQPITASLDDSLLDLSKSMVDHQVHHIPVVGKDGKLLGMVSTIDIVRLVADGVLSSLHLNRL
ncbi:inosine 5'-monophosphate dehydrogenase [Novipirellula aureliae]|uniref:Inosine 5'-monophosphate dehydrogenase n=1 Tax=Novipirellula aureliae TaxID=2527966 RepID=A0A5C6D9V5_9BACT|nr:CBS domain-containing protein [Novipirellula aureliae]TWU33650.1 inosine 5'-monophosphate dehydrogenase [Novipirellula aureliae]